MLDLRTGCDDRELDELIGRADAIGIDAPFGWPTAFVDSLANWRHSTWNNALRDSMRFQATDRFALEQTGRWPLSVSSDLIALPALRAAALLKRHGVRDKSGDGRFFEVYPAANLSIWGIQRREYKGAGTVADEARNRITKRLLRLFPIEGVTESKVSDHDKLDSVVAGISAWFAATGRSQGPPVSQRDTAAWKGWIHLPQSHPG